MQPRTLPELRRAIGGLTNRVDTAVHVLKKAGIICAVGVAPPVSPTHRGRPYTIYGLPGEQA